LLSLRIRTERDLDIALNVGLIKQALQHREELALVLKLDATNIWLLFYVLAGMN